VLASQFESFKLPITIMLSLPLSMVGMVMMLLVHRDNMSMMTSIGMILLMGLVTKNAILLVDHALHLEREEGISRRQAIIRAGTVRLRPILMTSFAMVGGMLPSSWRWAPARRCGPPWPGPWWAASSPPRCSP